MIRGFLFFKINTVFTRRAAASLREKLSFSLFLIVLLFNWFYLFGMLYLALIAAILFFIWRKFLQGAPFPPGFDTETTLTDDNQEDWVLARDREGRWFVIWMTRQGRPDGTFLGMLPGIVDDRTFQSMSESLGGGQLLHVQLDTLPHTDPPEVVMVLVTSETEDGVKYVRVRIINRAGKVLLDERRAGEYLEMVPPTGTAKLLKSEFLIQEEKNILSSIGRIIWRRLCL